MFSPSPQGPAGLKGGEGPQGPPGPVVSIHLCEIKVPLGKNSFYPLCIGFFFFFFFFMTCYI